MNINPVLQKQDGEAWGDSVLKLIETLNNEINVIQAGMDSEGDIFVKVELPLTDLGFEQFAYVILNLCQVSEQLLVPVLQAHAYDHYSEVHG